MAPEDVLTALLFKYAGPPGAYDFGKASWYGRPEGACDFARDHLRASGHPCDPDGITFADSSPSSLSTDPVWLAEIRADLIDLFDLILEMPVTELLLLEDPKGSTIEQALRKMRGLT